MGFRWFVVTVAQSLGVRGWVANTPDGDVEVVGLAAAGTLLELEAALLEGPPTARVSGVTSQDLPHETVDAKSFTVKH